MQEIKKKKKFSNCDGHLTERNVELFLMATYTSTCIYNIMSKYSILCTLPIFGPAVSNACITATARAALDLEM